jgi:NAD(P)-dependent dehydrogenase (short-subunit alcohol dehydrogenase family)
MKKVLIVTGGSRGIGTATAVLAAERGYQVCVNYLRNQEAANRVVCSIEQRGGKAMALATDIAVETEVIQLFNEVDEQSS